MNAWLQRQAVAITLWNDRRLRDNPKALQLPFAYRVVDFVAASVFWVGGGTRGR